MIGGNKSEQPEKPRYSVYFSHSWRPEHVDLNQMVWKEIAADCNLLVDEDKTPEPPYFINRIEEYIRRSDLFLSLLTYRKDPEVSTRADAMKEVDQRDMDVRCSTAGLFEVRLAERARKPRLILYDRRTRFEPGSENSRHVCYQMFEETDIRERDAHYIQRKVREWLENIREEMTPRSYEPNRSALVLLSPGPDREQIFRAVRQALRDADYTNVLDLQSVVTDVQILNRLFASSLLVADIGQSSIWDIYAMAHALFVPTIRVLRCGDGSSSPCLPWLLRGHPKGYQEDVIEWTDLTALTAAVEKRAMAMRDTRTMITDYETGRRILERRRYSEPHRIFISHNLKGPDRACVDAIVAQFGRSSISAWEYYSSNRSAEIWRTRMRDELKDATHALIILAEKYEVSEACDAELMVLLERKIPLFPFFYGSRRDYNPKLKELHHDTLSADPAEAAQQVLSRFKESLTGEKRT
jgi:hypothetical protein